MKAGLLQRDDIQGLRAVAVLAVILFHVNKDWLPGGFIGVDIFLVISGFLITSLVLRQKRDGSFSFLTFYASRIKRIVPAYLALLAVVSLCMAVILIPGDFDRYQKSLKAALYFNSNNFFSKQGDYFAPAAHELPLLHTWSLAVEMQFYLLLPAILAFIPRRYLGPALSTAAGLILAYTSFRLAHGQRHAQYFSLAARIPEFLVGSLLALRPMGQSWSSRASNLSAGVGLLLVLGSFLFITEDTAFPGLLALLPCLGAALLIAANKSTVNRWLSTAAMVWIGALSYSLYLWHWPILAAHRYFFETYGLPPLALLNFAMLTIACAYASYRYVELPFRQKSSGTTIARPAALVALISATMWLSHLINPRLVAPLPEALTRYAQPSEICHGNIVGDCLRGDKSAGRTMLLLGDSHAAHLNYFADVVGNAIQTKIRVISASSCVTIQGFDVERLPEWARAPCLAQIEKVQSYLPSSDGLIVAGMWQYQTKSSSFMEALDRFVSDAASRNQRVIVLAQVPMLASDVQRTHRFGNLGLPADVVMNTEWESANSMIQRLLQRHPNATFLNLARDRLFANPPFDNGILIYHDSHHLNEIGSRRYGEVAAPFLAKWASTSSSAAPTIPSP